MDRPTRDSTLIPLERELQESLGWFIHLRYVAGAAILLGSVFSVLYLDLDLPLLPLVLVGVAVLVYNLLLQSSKGLIARHRLRRWIHLQVAMDWLALATLVLFTGGIRSPLALAFTFHLILGAILLSKKSCYLLAASASLLLGGLALLGEVDGVATVPESIPLLGQGAASKLVLWLGLTVFLVATTYLATSITARLREKENALFRSERALNRAYHEMESLYQIGQVVNSTLDLNEVLRLIAEHATQLLNGKACFIRLFDKSGKRLYIGGSYGLSAAYINKGPVEVEKSLVDLEALQGGIVQVLEVAEDRRFQYRDEARAEGLRSMLCCPIRAKNQTLGVIRIYTAEPRRFSEQEESLLMNLSNLGAVAILNARSYGELREATEAKIWFARTTHHQLRAPLAAIQGVIDALPFAGKLNKQQSDLLARARKRVEDAFDTIRDLLDLAAAQRLQSGVEQAPVSLRESIESVLETAGEQAKSREIDFRTDMDEIDLMVRAEPADLLRIFSNLLDNAVKYTFSGGVKFSLTEHDGMAEAVVEDSGIGIEPEDRDRIFEGFYRSKAAKATGEIGTGLGLSIVQHLVDRLGGTVEVESEVGRGSRFTVRLPLAGRQEAVRQ